MFTRRVSHFRYHSPPADNDEYCLRPTITIDSKYYFLLSEPQTQMFTNDDEEEWSSASYAPSDGDDDDDEEGSSSSYDDDDVSNDHSSCSSLDDDDNITGPLILPSFTNFVLRRRRNGGADYNDDGINGDDEEDPQTTPQRKQQRPQAFRVFRKQQRSLRRKYHLIGCTPSRCSSCLLVFAMVVWLNVYVFYSDPRPSQGWWLDNSYLASSQDKAYAEMVQRRIGKPPKHFVKKVQGKGFFDNMLFHKPKSVEDLPDGCHYQKWQLAQYPNCNDLHEMDLKTLLKLQKQPKPKSNEISSSGRYIDSGLWRDVWSLAPRELPTQQQQELVVLKMMKPEHDVNMRNVERHRRDALAMERLTSTPNIVDIYGHCANTILTEYAPRGLPEILKHSNSKQQKLDYALQTAKGVASLHAQQIVHADLQSKQFLVQTNGVIKLNDFNRCRFLPIPDDHHNRTTNAPPNNHNNTEICPIRIPSAPGVFRSPEEYDQQPLTEKLDIYSLGNVLFEILADGARPFHNEGSGRIKEKVRHGQLPEIPPEILRDNQALATLVHLCLTHDPNHRIAAQDLVQELTILLEEQQG